MRYEHKGHRPGSLMVALGVTGLFVLSTLLITGTGQGSGVHPRGAGVTFCLQNPCGWKVARIPASVSTAQDNLNAIAYVDPQTVVVVGNNGSSGIILRSTDGGRNWSLVSSPIPNLPLARMTLVPGGLLLAGGGQGGLIASQDGGASWYVYPSQGLTGNLTEIGFVSLTFGYASTSQGLYVTRDAGETWSPVHSPQPGEVWAAAFTSPSVGWMDTGTEPRSAPSLYYTVNGGMNWGRLTAANYSLIASVIVPMGGTSAWVLGNQGQVWETTDGRNFTVTQLDTEQHTWWLSITGTSAWVVSDDANNFYTADGGRCWVEESVPGIPELYSVDFVDPLNGVAAGDGVIWFTSDAGVGAGDGSTCSVIVQGSAIPVLLAAVAAGVAGVAVQRYVWRRRAGGTEVGEGASERAARSVDRRRRYRGRRRYMRFR